jgi:glycine oxidase
VNASGSGERGAVAVIGGGIIGLSIAWRLSQAQHQVAVFDQAAAGGEASWAGAGMLAPGGEFDDSSELTELATQSRRMYGEFVREIEQASDLPIDYQECGGLDLAYNDQEELCELESRAERQSALGIRSKRITAGQALTFWPRLRREGLLGARFYPEDAIVNPRELTHALKQICRASGVSVSEHQRIQAVNLDDDGLTLVSDNGTQRCAMAVIAAGAWSSEIELTGVPALPSAEPVKGQLIGYQQPEQTCLTILRHGHTYLLQRANGLLIAGSSMDHVGFDREIDPFVDADIAARAGFVLPHLGETTPTQSWMGFRPASDTLHMGRWHSPRLYLAYGHFRNGILLAPVTASRIAAEINASWETL